jgi:hypothetical protein
MQERDIQYSKGAPSTIDEAIMACARKDGCTHFFSELTATSSLPHLLPVHLGGNSENELAAVMDFPGTFFSED